MNKNRHKNLPLLKIERWLYIFCFFLPLGFVKIFGVSITFFIFIIIIKEYVANNIKVFSLKSWGVLAVIGLFILFILSIIFAEESYKEVSIISIIKAIAQYFYWMILTLFLISWSNKLDLYILSKGLFWGVITYVFFYYSINPYVGVIPQNSFSFTLVTCVPIVFYYTLNRYSFKKNVLIAVFFLMAAIMSQSRTGSILVFIELSIIFLFFSSLIRRVLAFSLLPLTFVFIVIYVTSSPGGFTKDLAEVLYDYNPRVASLIESPEEVGNRDKSWLIRELMVKKGLMIFEEHPFLGIGALGFNDYWVTMDIQSKWLHGSQSHYNRKSAHNSYIQTLAESGVFAFMILILILLIAIKNNLVGLKLGVKTPHLFLLSSILGMSIYFYVISATTGALTWFLIGLALSKNKVDLH